jgi:hypothetical protein
LEPILTPYLTELQGLNSVECSLQTKAKTIFHLKLVASLFQSLDVKPKNENKNEHTMTTAQQQQNPVALIFPQILPLLQQVIRAFFSRGNFQDKLTEKFRGNFYILRKRVREIDPDRVWTFFCQKWQKCWRF